MLSLTFQGDESGIFFCILLTIREKKGNYFVFLLAADMLFLVYVFLAVGIATLFLLYIF